MAPHDTPDFDPEAPISDIEPTPDADNERPEHDDHDDEGD